MDGHRNPCNPGNPGNGFRKTPIYFILYSNKFHQNFLFVIKKTWHTNKKTWNAYKKREMHTKQYHTYIYTYVCMYVCMYRVSQKKWCIAISLIPGHCDNLQQSGRTQDTFLGYFVNCSPTSVHFFIS